jgi:multidrug efflux pump subunit AcrA (membrane-fusion protein)
MLSDTYSDFDALAAFSGEPGQFWPRFRAHAQQAFKAEGSCLLIQSQGGGVRGLTQSSTQAAQRVVDSGLVSELETITDAALHEWTGNLLVMALPAAMGTRLWLVLLDAALEKKESTLREVRMLAESYQSRRREQRTSEQVLGLSEIMDLGVSLGEITTFQDAALRLCHRLAALLGAARVSLGWMEGDALQLQATSHGGRVNTETQEAGELVRVMEEAADQNNEVAHPAIPGSHVITRAHKQFSEERQGAIVLSVPIRDAVKHQAQGVLLLERAAEDGAWTETELERLRLAADLVASRLSDLHETSGWMGKRLWRSVRRRAAGLLGTEHTGWKLLVVVLLLTVIVLAIIRVEHKVRAPFLLKTDAAAQSAAPFPGYIDEVRYHLGDMVKKDQVLVTLDRRELLLEEANAIAGRDKNEREARSYEAQGKLAEALMSKSAQKQDEAKLAIVRHRLAMTEIRAPFDGIVVEGDLRERLSSPVQVGERLFKIVQVRDLIGQLQVDERDIGYLSQNQSGELAFASRPQDKFEVKIERFEPVAEVRQEGNVFQMRVKVLGEPQDWWRPGMSGVCKVNTGKRSLLWILTHRTIETIRMWLWL